MLEAAPVTALMQDETETLSENVFRRIQAAIVKGEIAPGSKISNLSLPAPTASAAARCARPFTASKASACWCACPTSARGWFH